MDIPEIGSINPEEKTDPEAAPSKQVPVTQPATGFFSFHRGQNYYTSTGRKVVDFFVGLLLLVIISFLFNFVPHVFRSVFMIPSIGFSIFSLLLYPLYIAGIIFSFLYGRKWFAIGMLVNICISILLLILTVAFFLMMW
ncbi:hypothetical protein GOV07_05445 [Candidatus Woesearchaeota archaeon]|nr:hypothetical protein [Candidatus Woesearchaeota archaeon]